MIPPQFQGWEEDDLETASPSAGSSSHPSGLSIGCVITPKEPAALESRNGSARNSPPSPPQPHCPCSQAPLPHVWGTIPGIPTPHCSGGKGCTPASTRNSQIPPTPTLFSTEHSKSLHHTGTGSVPPSQRTGPRGRRTGTERFPFPRGNDLHSASGLGSFLAHLTPRELGMLRKRSHCWDSFPKHGQGREGKGRAEGTEGRD